MSPSLEPGLLQNPELLETPMTTYYFVAASEAFLTKEEPLEEVLRERVRVKRELAAATAEAKVSARVLIAMPTICMALLFVINPAYITFFTSTASITFSSLRTC